MLEKLPIQFVSGLMSRIRVPGWHHPSSGKMQVEKADSSQVVISAPKACLTITEIPQGPDFIWTVKWEIFFTIEHGVRNEVVMSAQELCAAFALNENEDDYDDWLEDLPRVSVAGKFFREGPFLNIPHPGIGKDGDPNISVLITGEIKKAVTGLVLEAQYYASRQLSFDF